MLKTIARDAFACLYGMRANLSSYIFSSKHSAHLASTKMAATETIAKVTIEEEEEYDVDAEEKAFLGAEPREPASPPVRPPLSPKFWLSAGVNTAATAAIVGDNEQAC
jgi:hypothetical protein